MTKEKPSGKSAKRAEKSKRAKTFETAVKDKLAERGISKEWMKKHLIITKA